MTQVSTQKTILHFSSDTNIPELNQTTGISWLKPLPVAQGDLVGKGERAEPTLRLPIIEYFFNSKTSKSM
jgi:hypothetical protein